MERPSGLVSLPRAEADAETQHDQQLRVGARVFQQLVFQQLKVPTRIVGFWDHAVTTADSRTRYVCIEVPAKDFDEPFDDDAVLRIVGLFERERFERPSSVCHQVLHHRLLFDALVAAAQEREAMVGNVYYFGTR